MVASGVSDCVENVYLYLAFLWVFLALLRMFRGQRQNDGARVGTLVNNTAGNSYSGSGQLKKDWWLYPFGFMS